MEAKSLLRLLAKIKCTDVRKTPIHFSLLKRRAWVVLLKESDRTQYWGQTVPGRMNEWPSVKRVTPSPICLTTQTQQTTETKRASSSATEQIHMG